MSISYLMCSVAGANSLQNIKCFLHSHEVFKEDLEILLGHYISTLELEEGHSPSYNSKQQQKQQRPTIKTDDYACTLVELKVSSDNVGNHSFKDI